MKKVLSILGLIAVLGFAAPAMAAPDGHKAPHNNHIKAGAHYRPIHHGHHYRPHSGFTVYTNFGGGYRYNPFYDCRVGWDYPCYRPCRPYYPSTGIYIRF